MSVKVRGVKVRSVKVRSVNILHPGYHRWFAVQITNFSSGLHRTSPLRAPDSLGPRHTAVNVPAWTTVQPNNIMGAFYGQLVVHCPLGLEPPRMSAGSAYPNVPRLKMRRARRLALDDSAMRSDVHSGVSTVEAEPSWSAPPNRHRSWVWRTCEP